MPKVYEIINALRSYNTQLEAKGYSVERWTDNLALNIADNNLSLRLAFGDSDNDTIYIREMVSINDAYNDVDTLVSVALSRMQDKVLAQRTCTEHMRGKWLQSLADLTTKGEYLDIGIEYIDALKATADRLATNILEDQSKPKDPYSGPYDEERQWPEHN